jgi:hypothetical protein
MASTLSTTQKKKEVPILNGSDGQIFSEHGNQFNAVV